MLSRSCWVTAHSMRHPEGAVARGEPSVVDDADGDGKGSLSTGPRPLVFFSG